MASHSDMLKSLLAKKKGTQANRDATAKQHKLMVDLNKNFKQAQANIAPTPAIMKSSQRGG